ncbi:MAG: RDD family protein [Vulcanimicrobiaceae bacterium]
MPSRTDRTGMERSVEVTTGESVAISYELAGLGSRFIAVSIDLAIQVIVAVAALALLAFVGRVAGVHAGSAATAGSKVASAIAIALLSFAGFLLFFGYFIFCEWRFGGRTPGKRLLGIRVVRDGGFPLDFTSAVVRNVVRILELGLGFYVVSAIATLVSPANRRLGDMAAGTIVVRDNRFERAAAPALDPIGGGRTRDDAVVAGLSVAERGLIRRYAARRAALSEAARRTVAADVAAAVRPKLAVPFGHLDDDDLLMHLAATALADD